MSTSERKPTPDCDFESVATFTTSRAAEHNVTFIASGVSHADIMRMLEKEAMNVVHHVEQEKSQINRPCRPLKLCRNLFDYLCDDTLQEILLNCDFLSAVRFAKCTSKSLRERVLATQERGNSGRLEHIWKEMYKRHGFSPLEETSLHYSWPSSISPMHSIGSEYIDHCRDRRQLLQRLFQTKKNRVNRRQCFSLPNRYFHFLPVLPFDTLDDGDLAHEHAFIDPPPVIFDCDSFVLTSTGTSPELLMLDPFNGSLSILSDCVQRCIASDEAMMEQAMVDAASFIHHRENLGVSKEWKDEHIAGAIIDASVYSNHSRHEYRTPPSQQLLDGDEYFNLDLAEYFPYQAMRRQNNHQGHGHVLQNHHIHHNQRPENDDIPQEFELTFVGVDAKPILDPHKHEEIIGSMVGVGRSIVSEAVRGQNDLVCTELCAWFRNKPDGEYGDRRVCRLPWAFSYVDIDPIYKRIFVSFFENDGPAPIDATESVRRQGMRASVVAYPLIPYHIDTGEGATKKRDPSAYFPEPLFFIHCDHPISSFLVDPTGATLMVATTRGTLEIWDIQQTKGCRRGVVNITKSLKERIHGVLLSARRSAKQHEENESSIRQSSSWPPQNEIEAFPEIDQFTDDGQTMTVGERQNINSTNTNIETSQHRPQYDAALLVLQRQPDLATLRSPVVSFHVARHLPLDVCGFVTLQTDSNEGCSLLLWTKDPNVVDYRVASLINLPLSARRTPRVSFDGSRLVVFGEDHIGLIVLVYNVLSSFEFIGSFGGAAKNVAESGGVYNLTEPPRVRFVNRIRHAALGGIENFDSIHMTCNERLLVVNTKTGNLLGGGGGSSYSEGLLVIDLEEKL